MEEGLDWLPSLELLADYGGDWERYVEILYGVFYNDFVDSKPVFRGAPLGLKSHPMVDGKEATFWHMISEGVIEADRTPDMRRCERIRWPRPIIEREDNPELKVWSETNRGDTRIYLWLEAESYLVVLAQRKSYVLPWTAFFVKEQHQREKYIKRWKRSAAV